MTKDSLLTFLKEPTRENFSTFLEENIGETNNVDFKAEWIEIEKIVQLLLGMANSGGGCIIIGVAENEGTMEIKGITGNIYDSAEFIKKVAKYFPNSLVGNIQLINFFYDHDVYGDLKNKKFQMVYIQLEDEMLPVICEHESRCFKKGDIFIRRGTSTEKINYEELNILISQKVEAINSKVTNEGLQEELQQLKILYDSIPSTISNSSFSALKQSQAFLQIFGKRENKIYPEESYEQYLVNIIQKKKKKIEKYL
jgi:hypothetical protein